MRRERVRFERRILLIAAAACLAPGVSAEHRSAVTLYAGAGYQGASETFYGDVPNMKRTHLGNDRASSVRVAAGCTVILYAGGDFRGHSTSLDRDVRSLNGTEVGNDTVSSLRLRCDRASRGDVDWSDEPVIALYRDAAFTGRREIFYQGDSDLRNNRIGDDAASSVRVVPGCRVTLYSDAGYRGRSVELSSEVRNLGNTRLGNDAVSSLRVRCRDRRDDRHDDRRDDRHDDRRDDGWHDRDDTGSGDGWNPWGHDSGTSGRGGATLYAGGDYSGRSETFFGDVDRLSGTEVGNDTVSSVRVAPGCRLVLFEHPHYQGNSSVVTTDVPSMRGTSLGNDQASSLRLDCGRRGGSDRPDDRGGVTLYRDVDFRGRGETFYRDARDLGSTEVGSDTVSSVRVSSGCRVTLYRHNDFRGEPTVLTRDAETLRFTAVGNDAVSSIEVDCR